MITPGRLDLVVQRWTPFVYLLEFAGLNFTDVSAMSMHIRLFRDAPGSPLVALTSASPSDEGLSFEVAAVDGVAISTVQIRINETTIEGLLLNAGKAGADIVLRYDLHVTGAGYPKTRWVEGDFTIRPGATQ